jgi:hypothetical protein
MSCPPHKFVHLLWKTRKLRRYEVEVVSNGMKFILTFKKIWLFGSEFERRVAWAQIFPSQKYVYLPCKTVEK